MQFHLFEPSHGQKKPSFIVSRWGQPWWLVTVLFMLSRFKLMFSPSSAVMILPFLFHHCCVVPQGGSVRRAFPPSGDKCHSCERRVYMVERVCAEGLYFHRECFRCTTCGCTLRQGAHAFDSEHGSYHQRRWQYWGSMFHPQSSIIICLLCADVCCDLTGKLYCKLHFDQLNNGPNLRRNLSPRSVSDLRVLKKLPFYLSSVCWIQSDWNSLSESLRSCSSGATSEWWTEIRVQRLSRPQPSANSAIVSRYLPLLHKETPELAPECDPCCV